MPERLEELRVTLFGVEGVGGLVRKVESVEKRVGKLEARVNTISGRWLALMTVLAVLGQFAANYLARLLTP